MSVSAFKVPPLEQCPSYDIMRERLDEEQTYAIKELSRLKQSYAFSERQRILQLANHAGENAAQMTLQQGMHFIDSLVPWWIISHLIVSCLRKFVG